MSAPGFLPQAEEDLDAAVSHYETLQPGLGIALHFEISETLQRIAELPLAGRAVRGKIKRQSSS